MKRQWLAGIVFLAGVGYLAGMNWKPSRLGPRLEVSPQIDVGELIHGEERVVRVGFRNTGDQALTVDPVALACACAKPKLDRAADYQPGEVGWFEMTLKAVASPGSAFQQQVQLDSNDARMPRQLVVVGGKMQSLLRVTPARLRIDEIVGASWSRQVLVAATEQATNLQIVGLTCTIPGVSLGDPEELTIDERGEYQIDVRHPGASNVGQQTGQIEILTNSLTVPRLLVPIEIQIASHIKVNPTVLMFRASDLQEQQVGLTASLPFELTSTAGDEAWDFRIDSIDEERKSWQVTLRPKTAATMDRPRRGVFPLSVEGIGPKHEVSINYVVLPSAKVE